VEVLSATAGEEEAFDTKDLKKAYVQSSNFDPNAFFFLTYRSHAIGLCLVWPVDGSPSTYEIKHLSCVPGHRNKGVEECLINLAIKYCRCKGAKKVLVPFDEPLINTY
jgi:ribosomal protein S18 acetylase RimI-like enzyme